MRRSLLKIMDKFHNCIIVAIQKDGNVRNRTLKILEYNIEESRYDIKWRF